MKHIKTKSHEFYITDNPIKNDFDLYMAIRGAEYDITEAIGEIFYGHGNKQKSQDMKKIVNKVFDNMYDLIKAYRDQERQAVTTMPKDLFKELMGG